MTRKWIIIRSDIIDQQTVNTQLVSCIIGHFIYWDHFVMYISEIPSVWLVSLESVRNILVKLLIFNSSIWVISPVEVRISHYTRGIELLFKQSLLWPRYLLRNLYYIGEKCQCPAICINPIFVKPYSTVRLFNETRNLGIWRPLNYLVGLHYKTFIPILAWNQYEDFSTKNAVTRRYCAQITSKHIVC